MGLAEFAAGATQTERRESTHIDEKIGRAMICQDSNSIPVERNWKN
jgi:hypothetical protein